VAKELEKLNALQPEFAVLQAEIGLVARNAVAFFGAASDAVGWFAYGLAGLLVWGALCYPFWAIGRLQRGWALLMHGRLPA
jgi:hypothetical protein